ncbi:protein Wnt-6-like [Parasteatoda tepidariorum]|uniref:protein Wnt-6-like n=1 Tax=Parasteatoda tepidariorum TaxID=114398 RepID=UPI0039BCB5B2
MAKKQEMVNFHYIRNSEWLMQFDNETVDQNNQDTRETGFVNAITAAGIIFSITQACSYGQLLDCSCERSSPPAALPPPPQISTEERWEWGGCSDNINFGYQKSKEFMDDRFRKRSDLKTLLLKHNYEAGRLKTGIG